MVLFYGFYLRIKNGFLLFHKCIKCRNRKDVWNERQKDRLRAFCLALVFPVPFTGRGWKWDKKAIDSLSKIFRRSRKGKESWQKQHLLALVTATPGTAQYFPAIKHLLHGFERGPWFPHGQHYASFLLCSRWLTRDKKDVILQWRTFPHQFFVSFLLGW